MAGPDDVESSRCVDFDEVQKCVCNPEYVIVDVRGPQEVKDDGSIQGSVNIPIGDVADRFKEGASVLSEKIGRTVAEDGSNIIFHCKMGGRATKAALLADEFGFTKSRVYKSGLKDWMEKGGTVCKDFCPF